ncbi:MAG: 4-hydroxythreonine-4-phosphate dehydrogenase PdxA [Myxococcaceae bacterium]|nr:MAG: 4-hydroxythreonine-4-phosphate dehydrogenase PdxA [Myxococcaceae bacterium]
MSPITLAISAGCPCGIGPEVTAAALAALSPKHPDVTFVVHGDAGALSDAGALRGVRWDELPRVRLAPATTLSADERRPGPPSMAAGRAQLVALDAALDTVLSRSADALVTGPIDKAAVTRSGTPFLGHTEHLAERCGVPRVVMMFAGPRLRTTLVTTHRPIARLSVELSREAVRESVLITARALRTWFGMRSPRIVVCGLNPHAGEGGLIGREEIEVIAPALDEARAALGAGVEIVGPMGAESAYRKAKDGRFDAVVAMFHDQATIASKLLDFGEAVNVTLGLPIIRTSVDHGTGADIAGQGIADPSGMVSALELAISFARQGRPRP